MDPNPGILAELQRAKSLIAEAMTRQARASNPAVAAAPTSVPGKTPPGVTIAATKTITISREVRVLASAIDHTRLRAATTRVQIEKLCQEALEFFPRTVCVNPNWVPAAVEALAGSPVRVTSVCGFPLGATTTHVKEAEAEAVIKSGAAELDMVMNIGALKSGDSAAVEEDISSLVRVCHGAGVTLKVILENCYLTQDEKKLACRMAQSAGADFVKTSTGFGPSGATEPDVRLMRVAVGPHMGVKAAGGIKTLANALAMIQAGANRLGTSSGFVIVAEAARLVNVTPPS